MGHDHHAHAAEPRDVEVCVCFHVPRRKLEAFCRREQPRVSSLLHQCLGAGTGCGWCVPFLRAIHAECCEGGPAAAIPARDDYLAQRKAYHKAHGIVRD